MVMVSPSAKAGGVLLSHVWVAPLAPAVSGNAGISDNISADEIISDKNFLLMVNSP
jgi:hypothetical protein